MYKLLESILDKALKNVKKRNKYVKPLPKVGDDIYVDTIGYLGHGVGDFQGGLCKVIEVEEGISGGEETHYITVDERPNTSYNWELLCLKQDELKEQFGDKRGYADPDYSPECNPIGG